MKKTTLFILFYIPILFADDLNKIQSDYNRGLITLDEFVVYQVAHLSSNSLIPERYQTTFPVKCGTHIFLTLNRYTPFLSLKAKKTLEELGIQFNRTLPGFQRPSGLNLSYDSGILRFHYTTEGIDAVDPTDSNNDGIPDYINTMVEAFDKTIDITINRYGFSPPPGDGWYPDNGGNELYDIYIMSLNSGFYGYVQPEFYADHETGNNENSDFEETNAFTSYMVLRNNYNGFYNEANSYGPTSEFEAVQVSVAHEFFHTIQFGYDGWEARWLLEATATWMEDEIFDDVNDNYQYLALWFQKPYVALNQDESPHWYGSWIFFRYLSEHVGGYTTIREIFEQSLIHDSNLEDFSIQTIDETLLNNGSSFSSALINMSISNVLLTSNSITNPYNYEEADNYINYGINPHFEKTILLSDSLYTYQYENNQLKQNASHYLELITAKGPLNISFIPHDIVTTFYPKIIVQETSGSITANNIGKSTTIQIPQSSSFATLVIVTGKKDTTYNYSVTLNPKIILPTELTLLKNYPNPFPDITTIQFFTPIIQPITITVVDITGRKVAEIHPNKITEGINVVKFEAHHLPTGPYILKLKGRDTTSTQRIMLIK